jgi:CIC family chloride channel protein
MRLLAPVGAAAGIAAAFNTPIMAVLFVIEEVLGGWNSATLGSIVLASVSAVVTSRAFLGDHPLFQSPAFELRHPSEMAVYLVMGLASGLLASLLTRTVVQARIFLVRRLGNRHRFTRAAAAGLFAGVIGLWFPQVMGAGYSAVDGALHDQYGWQLLLAIGLLKVLVTSAAYSAGIPGGMFAPTLFIGAMVGGGLGALAGQFWPFPIGGTSAFVLVGMGTFFAAVFRSPMTSIFMVFEVSASYRIILPVMVANMAAYLVARRLQPRPFFDSVALLEGIQLPSQEELREQRPSRVEDVMRAYEPGGTPRWTPALGWADDSGPLPTLFADQPLEASLARFGPHRALPVVSRRDARQIVGVLYLRDCLERYGIVDALK